MIPDLVAAIDIGASKTLLSVRPVSELREGWRRPGVSARKASHPEPADLVDWAAGEIDRRCRSTGGRLVAIGVAAPGPVDRVGGLLARPFNLGWSNVPIAAMLSDQLAAPVALEDDANAAALGEWRFGAGVGTDPFAYLTISSGIGGGVVIGGQLVRGIGGNAGEVGHLVIDPAGPPCACGHRGDVESFAGGYALARRAREVWPRPVLEDGRPAPRSAEAVFRAARAGDPLAVGLVVDATRAVATALAAISSVVEPERIVVGGSIGLGQRRLIRRSASLARSWVMPENGSSLRIEPAALGHESVLAGAAGLGLRLVDRP